MSGELFTRAADLVEVRSAEERIIEFRAVPYMKPSLVSDGGAPYREQFARGAFEGTDPSTVLLYWRHQEPVGRILTLREKADGLYGTAKFSDTTAGRDAWVLARDGVEQGVSIGFQPVASSWSADKTLVTRDKAALRHIATTDRPAHAGAQILATREEQPTTESEPEMTDSPTTPTAPVEVRDNRVEEILERMTGVESIVTELAERRAPAPSAPLFRSFGEYAKALAQGDEKAELLQRALAAASSADGPGLFPDSWVTGVNGLVNNGRPLATAFGVTNLPADGMTIHYPRITTAPTVAKQALQTDSISSTKMVITDATSTVDTYAGGGRLSRVLIDRSTPNYLDVLLRAFSAAYGKSTGAAFNTALIAGATANTTASFSVATATTDTYIGAVAQACADIFDGSGLQANIIGLSSDMFISWAKLFSASRPLFEMTPSANGSNNVGSLDLSSLGGNFANIRVVVDTQLPVRTLLVGSTEAGKWHEAAGSPFQLNGENVDTISKDFAVYGYGTTAIYLPAAVRKQTLTA